MSGLELFVIIVGGNIVSALLIDLIFTLVYGGNPPSNE